MTSFELADLFSSLCAFRLMRFRGSAVSDMLSVVSMCLSVSTRLPVLCSQRLLIIGAIVAALVIAGAFQVNILKRPIHEHLLNKVTPHTAPYLKYTAHKN